MPDIRPYDEADERSWLHCRLLSFFDSAYFDDVHTAKVRLDIELVAVDDDRVIGLIDVEIAGALATIDTIAIHPDAQHGGLATQLLDVARARLPETVAVLDAWTRDDHAANEWYRRNGFVEEYRYLHVYAEGAPFERTDGLVPVKTFAHASLDEEGRLRTEHARVHVCRRYVRPLS